MKIGLTRRSTLLESSFFPRSDFPSRILRKVPKKGQGALPFLIPTVVGSFGTLYDTVVGSYSILITAPYQNVACSKWPY